VSPRRRLLVVAVVALAAVVLAALAARALVRAPTAVPAPDRPGPVLLVPGYGGGVGSLTVLADRLRATGRQATVVRLPGDGTGDLAEQARTLDRLVSTVLRDGAESVDIVGYSAGGVVARLWVQQHDGARKARRIVTLGSPHHGTDIAGTGAAVASEICPTACRQLAPGSQLLTSLDSPVPSPPQWLSVWTERDDTVRPPESARLDGAVNVPVQSVCPASTVDHGGLPTDPVVTALVLAALGPEPITSSVSSECG